MAEHRAHTKTGTSTVLMPLLRCHDDGSWTATTSVDTNTIYDLYVSFGTINNIFLLYNHPLKRILIGILFIIIIVLFILVNNGSSLNSSISILLTLQKRQLHVIFGLLVSCRSGQIECSQTLQQISFILQLLLTSGRSNSHSVRRVINGICSNNRASRFASVIKLDFKLL